MYMKNTFSKSLQFKKENMEKLFYTQSTFYCSDIQLSIYICNRKINSIKDMTVKEIQYIHASFKLNAI